MIFITNDDGLSEGSEILMRAAKKIDRCYAILPSKQKSASAKGMTLHKALRIMKKRENLWEINGTPADAVSFAIFSKEFEKPSLILSGINIGLNTSLHSFYSSGTIGACIEAALHNIPSIAFSIERCEKIKEAEKVEKKVVELIEEMKEKIKPGIIANINLPNEIENSEVVFCKPSEISYQITIEKRMDPLGKPYYWHYGKESIKEKGTDHYEVKVKRNIAVSFYAVRNVVVEPSLIP